MAQSITQTTPSQKLWWRCWLSNLLWLVVLFAVAIPLLKHYSSVAQKTDEFAALRDATAQEVKQLKECLDSLQKEKEALENSNPIIIEKEARKQLHYARVGEITYKRDKFRFLFDPEEIVADYLTPKASTPPTQDILGIEIKELKMPTIICSTVLVTLLFFYDPKAR